MKTFFLILSLVSVSPAIAQKYHLAQPRISKFDRFSTGKLIAEKQFTLHPILGQMNRLEGNLKAAVPHFDGTKKVNCTSGNYYGVVLEGASFFVGLRPQDIELHRASAGHDSLKQLLQKFPRVYSIGSHDVLVGASLAGDGSINFVKDVSKLQVSDAADFFRSSTVSVLESSPTPTILGSFGDPHQHNIVPVGCNEYYSPYEPLGLVYGSILPFSVYAFRANGAAEVSVENQTVTVTHKNQGTAGRGAKRYDVATQFSPEVFDGERSLHGQSKVESESYFNGTRWCFVTITNHEMKYYKTRTFIFAAKSVLVYEAGTKNLVFRVRDLNSASEDGNGSTEVVFSNTESHSSRWETAVRDSCR
jgi:hypothetical protein